MAMFGGAAPGRNWADMVMLIGAGLKDASSGGSDNLTNVMQLQSARQKQAQQMALAQKAMGLFGGQAAQLKPDAPSVEAMANGVMAGDPNAPTLDQVQAREPMTGGIDLTNPDTQRQLMELQLGGLDISPMLELVKAGQGQKPQIIEGPDGIYKIAGSNAERIKDYPAKPNTTPGQINPQTGRWEWAPGYLEGQGQLTGVRRDAVVSRPMPQRARAGGSNSGLPAGFSLD